MRVLDIQDDLGALLLSKLGNAPSELVKSASWQEPATALERDFALVLIDTDGKGHRKYACHDPGSVVVSMLYLENAQPHLNRAAIKVAAASLSALAQDWGIPVPVEVEKMANLELSPGDCRHLVGGRRVLYHPPKIASAQPEPTVFDKVAAAERAWADLTPFERRAAVQDLLKEAELVPISIPKHMYGYAGSTLSSKFASFMLERRDYTSDPDVQRGYDVLAKTAAAFEPDSVVAALYELDGLAHLRWAGGDRYGEKLADPVRCVFTADKTAAFSWRMGAESVNENELFEFASRPKTPSLFLGVFTDAVWRKFQKDPIGTFQNMPQEQKVLVSRMARNV